MPAFRPVSPRHLLWLRRTAWALLGVLAASACGGGESLGTPGKKTPSAVAVTGGDAQTATVATPVTDTLEVRVTDVKQAPVPGAAVVFRAIAGGTGALLVPDTAETDADGRARSRWVLGQLAGAQRVEARVVGTALVATFNATGLAAAADTIFALAGDAQDGGAGQPLADSLVVVVTDAYGNPVAGQVVHWAVTGGGSVSADSTVTGANGRAAVQRTLGPTLGAQGATATVAGLAGSPVGFGHTALSIATDVVIVAGDSQSALVGSVLPDTLVVRVVDGQGQGVPGRNVAFVPNTGAGSANPRTATTDSLGEARTVWTLGGAARLDTLAALVPGVGQALFTATALPGAADTVFAVSLTSQIGTAGQSVGSPPAVRLFDVGGNPVAGGSVSFHVVQGGGLVSDGAVADSVVTIMADTLGVARVAAWQLGPGVGANALEARVAAAGTVKGNPVSFTATGNAGSAARLAFVTQPADTAVNGIPLTRQPTVQVQDASGNPVPAANRQVTASISSTAASLRGTRTVASDAAGLASFGSLEMIGVVGSYRITVTAPGLLPDSSTFVALLPGAAAKLGITTQPSSTGGSGLPFGQQPVVQVQDSSGNATAAGGITVTAALATGTGTLGGTTAIVTQPDGSASYTDLSISGTPGNRTIGFSAPGLGGVVSSTVQIGAGNPTALVVAVQPPATARSGVVFGTQPVAQLRDASGNNVALAGLPVTVAVSAGGTLTGTLTVNTNANGAAAFPGLALIGLAGDYTLSFSSPGLTGDTSGTIALTAGLAAHLTIETEPSGAAQSGVPFAVQPVLQVRDSLGNPLSQSGLTIVASLASGAGGTLRGAFQLPTDTAGRVSYGNLNIAGPIGSYTLRFTGAAGSTVDTAVATPTTLSAGPAAKLLLTTAPSPTAQNNVPLAQQPVLTVADSANNPVLAAGTVVTAAIGSGAPALAGGLTATTNAAGVASFSTLRFVGLTGGRNLLFSSGTLTAVGSATITVSAGPAYSIALNAGNDQVAPVGQAVPVPPRVFVADTSGNAVTGAAVTFAVTLGGGSLTAPDAVTGANGLATPGNWILGPVAGPDSISATAAGLVGSPVLFGATGIAGGAARVLITTEPSAAAANGITLATQPTIQLLDINGNPAPQAGRAITATLLGATGQLRGTKNISTVAGGTAAFTDLDLIGPVGTYRIIIAGTGLAPDTSQTIALGPGLAAKLALTQPPSAQVMSGVAFPQQPIVRVQDSSGNAVNLGGLSITAAIATGTGTLGGTLSATTNASGIASFGNLSIAGPTGPNTIGFSATGLSGVTSGTVTVSAGSATMLAVVAQPSATARSGVVLGTQPSVQLQDAAGTAVKLAGVPVTAAASAGGSVRGIATVTTNANGVANFNGISLAGPVGSYTLNFSSSGLTGASSAAVDLTAGLPAALAVVTAPSGTAQNGIALAQQPALRLLDDVGNPVAQSGVTVAAAVLTGPGGTVRGGTSVLTDAAGVGSFSGLNLFGPTGGYTLKFDGGTGGQVAPIVSGTITLTSGPAAALLLTTAPSATPQNGVPFGTQPVVRLADSSGNLVSLAGVQVTATIGSGAPALGGTVTASTNGSGIASFTNLSLTGALGNRTLTFLGNGLQSVSSGTLTVGTGPAKLIALNGGNNQSGTTGQTLPVTPTVVVTDTTGNPVAGASITWSVTAGGGAVGAGTSLTASNGVADPGGWTLGAAAGADSLSATLAGVPGSPVRFGATATAAGSGILTLLTPPSNSVANGSAFAQQPEIQLEDGLGTPLTDNGVPVTATVTVGSVVGTATVNTVNGVATFTNLGLAGPVGSRSVTFEAGGFTGVTTGAIGVTAGPGVRLQVLTEPSADAQSGVAFGTQPAVQLVDPSGNPVSSSTTVTALLLSGSGTLIGTNTAATGGGTTATFSNLGISGLAGNHALLFTASGVGSDTSQAIALAAGAPAAIAAVSSTSQGGTVRRPVNAPPVVQVTDAAGNPVAGVAVTFAVTGGGGSLNGAATSTNSNGFAGLADWTLGGTVGSNTVTATASGGGISGNPVLFTATAGSAVATTIALNGGNGQVATVGTAVAVAPSVLVTDAFGNPVAGVTVSFTVGGGGGSLTGANAVSGANGVATVGSWTLGNLAGVNTLAASVAGLTGSPVSFTATATAGAAANIARHGGDNQSRPAGSALPVDPEVLVTDASGNPVAGVAVTFAVTGGGGSVTGGNAVTGADGIARVGSWTLGATAGTNTLAASSGTLFGSPVSFTATGVPGAANAAQTTAVVPAGTRGVQTVIVIQARDQFGNDLTSGGATVAVTVSGANPGAATVSDLGNGTYIASYVPAASGTDQIAITLNGAAIAGSPYSSSIP